MERQQTTDCEPGPGLNVVGAGPPTRGYREFQQDFIIVRRAHEAGVEVDITGLSLAEAARAMDRVFSWLREDQPRVRVISAGQLVGRYRKRMKR